MKRHILFAAAASIALTACAENPVAPELTSPGSASRNIAPTWAKTVVGTTGEGADYDVYVPANWNGDVVYYAHGIKDVADPIALATNNRFPEFRDSLGVMGYAVASSSFSENGWAVKDGVQKIHQLRGLFASIAGQPRRSFITGHSMGGLITVALAEKFPDEYDGALPMCGVLGGAQKQIDYIANVRTLFDFFYPNALPGNALDMPADLNLNTQVLLPAQNAIFPAPTGAILMSRIDQAHLAGNNPTEIITSILTAIAFDARGADDLLDRTHGHSPFDNSATVYTGTLPPSILGAVNAGVARFTETPDAANYLARYYEPTGNLRIPMVSIHTTRDPLVPVFHEGVYAGLVGTNPLLFQRQIDAYGHCNFTINDMMTAFRDLTGWVESGVKP